ncbi:MAG: LytR/AlgR family response regulator transcription factor [Faecalibacillus sp.]
MKVIIIDDDYLFAKTLKEDVYHYFKQIDNDLSITLKCDHFLDFEMEEIDIAFIDIDLNVCNGINIAKFLRKMHPHLIIIFVSRREELVFQTLSTGIFQFIRKSKYKQDSVIVFEQLKKYIEENFDKQILVINGRKTLIKTNSIQYILSIGHDVIIKTDEKEYTLKSSIQEMLKTFHSRYLIQIQRNLIINFHFIKDVKGNTIMTMDDNEYKLGRIYQKEFINQYEDFLLKC